MQYMDNVVPYGYAIEIPGGITTDYHNVFTIKDVTFLNAYRGICASITPSGITKSVTHEQLHLENIRGTILREGMHLTNSSEVGAFNTIDLSSKYWANAGEEFNAPNKQNIIDFTSKNSVGLILGDLEWQEIENVNIEDYQTGIYFHNKTRTVDYGMAFIGSLYNLTISGAEYGIYVENLYPNLGIEFANSTIEGSKYAVINNSPETEGHLKLSGVTLNGAVGGVNVYYNNQLNGEIKGVQTPKLTYNLPKMELYNVLSYNVDNTGECLIVDCCPDFTIQKGLCLFLYGIELIYIRRLSEHRFNIIQHLLIVFLIQRSLNSKFIIFRIQYIFSTIIRPYNNDHVIGLIGSSTHVGQHLICLHQIKSPESKCDTDQDTQNDSQYIDLVFEKLESEHDPEQYDQHHKERPKIPSRHHAAVPQNRDKHNGQQKLYECDQLSG